MASRAALRGLMRTAGQRPTSLSPSSAVVALRSSAAGASHLVHPHMAQTDIGGATAAWLAGEEQVRCANLKAISNRMKSVSSVAKITKAMKMVAAAKLRSVQTLQENARPFADGMQEFFTIMDDVEATVAETAAESGKNKTSLVIAITSDRGLCGGVNSSVVKEVKKLMAEDSEFEHSIMLLGDKGREGIARVHGDAIVLSFKDMFKGPVSFDQVCVICEDILTRNFDKITLVYNEFKSVIAQEVTRRPIVGLDQLMGSADSFSDYEFDSDMDSAQVLVDLFEFQLATQLHSAALDNATSEQASRVSSMDGASRNANEMHDKLSLQYNRQRQASITAELSEIVAGAAAVE